MFKHTPTGKTLRAGRAWVDDLGFSHPSTWASKWTADEKAAHDVVETPDPVRPDDRLYYYDENGGTINITPKNLDGVKSAQIALVKTQQGSILAQTDWAYVRLADIGVSVPEAIKTYRDAVRAAAAAMEAEINGATTTDEMAVVLASEGMQWPVDASVVTTTDEVAVYAVSGPLP